MKFEDIYDEKIKVYSFDIFDTIFSRKIHPEYVKKLWAIKITKICELDLTSVELYELRSEAENECGKTNSISNDFEYKYDEVIEYIYDKLNINTPKNKFVSKCKEIEIEIESKVLFINDDIFNIIKRLKQKGKIIICISDMYLTENMVREIFENLGINKFIDKIYMSCEFLQNKLSGKLYKRVIKDYKIKNNEMFMIGDNKEKDVNIPISLGIKAKHIDRSKQFLKYDEFNDSHDPDDILKNFKKLSKTNNDRFQHTIFSLFLFTDKLYYKARKENITKLTFLSREGEFLKKLFDYYLEVIGDQKTKTDYLIVSRKSTYLPSLKNIDKEDFHELLNQYNWTSLHDFICSINFSEKEIDDLKKELPNIDFDEPNTDLINSEKLKTLKSNKTFRNIFEKKRIEQTKNFRAYAKEIFDDKKVNLVDIGWHGSMQNNLSKIFANEYEFDGYYFGLITRDLKKDKNKTGIIVYNAPQNSYNFQVYDQNRTLFEFILGATHGSADHYEMKNGKATVKTFRKKEEKELFENVVKPIQDEMFEIFKNICNLLTNTYYDDKKVEKTINRIHFEMVFHPNKKSIKLINNVFHYDNFGVFTLTKLSKVKKNNLINYIKEHILFVKTFNRGYFNDSFWPMLKLINNKLYIPYYAYYIIKKRKFKEKGIII